MRVLFRWLLILFVLLPGWTTAHAQNAGSGILVLVYHEITTDNVKPPGDTVIRLARFREEMQYLAEHGYHPIGLDQLIEYMRSGAPVPPRPIVLTFDDGWRNVLNAVPVLNALDFRAAFSIITGKGIGGDYLDWSDIQELAKNPRFEFVSHTVTHPWNLRDNLVTWIDGRIPGKGAADVRNELRESKRTLERELNRKIPYLAWPCGWYNDAMIKMAEQEGYTAQLTVDSGFNTIGGDLATIRRTPVDGACDMATFEQVLHDGQAAVCGPGRRDTTPHSPYPVP